MQKRAFGIETEYSVACLEENRKFYTNINIYGQVAGFLRRVFPLDKEAPDKLTELLFFPPIKDNDLWLASNGARFYFDMEMAVPEYSTPECQSPREAVIHNLAGDSIVEDIRKEALRRGLLNNYSENKFKDIFVFKMNTHFSEDIQDLQKSVGCHENYTTLSLSGFEIPAFSDFMTPFLLSRQIFDGSCGIRLQNNNEWQYVISQRPFFITDMISSQTTGGGGRGFIAFKNEFSEVLSGQIRFHLHCGDSNMSPWGKFVSLGATHLVLRAYEEYRDNNWKYKPHPSHCIEDLYSLARDPTLKFPIRILEGDREKKLSAIEIQKEYINFVEKSLKNLSDMESDALSSWKSTLKKLELGYEAVSQELDWAIKLNFIKERLGGNLNSPKTRFASALYHDISERGIYNTLLRSGEILPFCDADEIKKCRITPPPTRAQFRSRFLKILLETGKLNYSYNLWGGFGNFSTIIYIRDPLDMTTEEGENFLESLKIIPLKSSE